MTSIAQRQELQNKIWKIANDVRGSVDGWDFKQFVLGTLFYRFISENFTNYIEGGDENVNYPSLSDDVITPEIKDDAIKTKGYFIYPSQLFVNVAKNANTNSNLNTDLKAIFDSIESTSSSEPKSYGILTINSEPFPKTLFTSTFPPCSSINSETFMAFSQVGMAHKDGLLGTKKDSIFLLCGGYWH